MGAPLKKPLRSKKVKVSKKPIPARTNIRPRPAKRSVK